MARNIQKISKSDISLSITGIAGPDGGTTKSLLDWYILASVRNLKLILENIFNSKLSRAQIQKKTCIKALKLIEEFL